MKLLIILLAMLGTVAGAAHSWHKRGLLVEAALLSEGFSLSAHVKLRVADHYVQRGIMPSDNRDVDLPPPKSLFGTSVKRIAVNRGGVLTVDFEDRIGDRAMTFTPAVSPVSGLLSWNCTSDSIERAVLEQLRPSCAYQPATGASQLMNAIANGDLANVNTLIAEGVSPDTVVNGNTPLMLAAKKGDSDVVDSLLAAGAKIDNPALSSERRTPLMVAITSNNPEVVALLLSKGASVTRQDYRGMSAMDHAIVTDQRLGGERFGLMVSARYNPHFAGNRDAAVSAVVNEKIVNERLRGLYDEYRRAADTCHVQRLSSLLASEGELSNNEVINGVPLLENIRKPECAVALQAHLLTKNSYSNAVKAHLAERVQRCDTTGVGRTLAENPGLDVTEPFSGKSPIDRSVSAGCYAALRLMVREENLVGKLSDDIIVTAISVAPQNMLVKLVGNLIAADANVNGVDRMGQSPLATAIAMEQPVVAKFLVDAGASLNQKTSNGSYPVIEATKKGYEHLALQMVAGGADLNARDSLGRTALFAAVGRGQQRLVKALIQAGADLRITDSNGINPVVLAESYNLKTIKSMLIAGLE
ncbi:MAG: ankyrin repeat domain-containing protein [Granulosicoccus sp.]